jgi:hypothetical protein
MNGMYSQHSFISSADTETNIISDVSTRDNKPSLNVYSKSTEVPSETEKEEHEKQQCSFQMQTLCPLTYIIKSARYNFNAACE